MVGTMSPGFNCSLTDCTTGISLTPSYAFKYSLTNWISYSSCWVRSIQDKAVYAVICAGAGATPGHNGFQVALFVQALLGVFVSFFLSFELLKEFMRFNFILPGKPVLCVVMG